MRLQGVELVVVAPGAPALPPASTLGMVVGSKNHSSGRERGGKSASVRQVRLHEQMTAIVGSGRLVRPSSEDSI